MKKGFRVLCLFVFVIGALSFSLARDKKKGDIEPSRSFVIVAYEAQATPDGKMTITGWRTRYVKANGEWKTVIHGANATAAFTKDNTGFAGTSSPVFAGTTEGVFAKASGSNERKSLSPPSPEGLQNQFHSHAYLKNHPEFVRMDSIVGLEVYVLRGVNREYPNYWIETSYSPLTGRTPLRTVEHSLDGSEFIIEAVRIEFRDVPDNLNEDITTLPNTSEIGEKKPLTPKNPN